MTPLWLQNLASYSVQLALVVLACGATARGLRAAEPGAMLRYWRAVLLLALLLPALQPWSPATRPVAPTRAGTVQSVVAAVGGVPVAWPQAIALAWALGAAARLVWLVLGLLRLGQYRRRASAVELEAAGALARQLGVAPRVAVSHQLDMPVTFGALRGTILLPARLLESEPARQRAVLCHEMLHVARRDWRATLGEECVRALLWFHPALHWLLRRIRLTREQLVDREVVALTGNRRAYLEALLDAARAVARPQPVAALLPKPNQLGERIDLLLEEVSMSTRTTRAARAGCGLALVLSSALAVRAFPLSAPPGQDQKKETPKPAVPIEGAPEPAPGKRWFREQAPAPKSARAVGGGVPGGVVGGVPGGVAGGIDDEAQEKPMPGQAAPEKKTRKLVRKVEPAFPEDGKKLRGREDVILSITIEESGAVSDVKIVKGHPSFNESAVAAVKQWKFEPSDRSPAEATVTIRFVPPPPPPPPPKPQP